MMMMMMMMAIKGLRFLKDFVYMQALRQGFA